MVCFNRLAHCVLVVLCAASSALAADYNAGSAFPAALVLAPSPGNVRNSEGDFIQLRDGRVMFVYSHYYQGQGEDADPAYLAARYSSDGGATWTDNSVEVVANEGRQNVMSVSLERLPAGEIALFYLRKNSPLDLRPVVRFSTDEAKTWSEPVEIIPEDDIGYYVVNNDRVVQLSSGRLVIPCGHHVDNTPAKHAAYAEAVCYLSDDQGKTWRRGGRAKISRDVQTGLQEPGVVELSDGRLLMFCRTDAGRQYFSYSKDQGETWSDPQPGTLQSPLAPASIERITGANALLAIWNNNSTRGYHRTPLTAAVSRDDGQTWQNLKNLESDPDGFFCYTAIEFAGDHVLLAYCAGRNGLPGGLLATKLARVPLSLFLSSKSDQE
jgi:Neuraminidase (sialidase)